MLRAMRSSRTHGRAVWAASVAALVCVACENPVDTTPNRFDAASTTPFDGAARAPDGPLSDATDESGACECLEVGQTFRFDSLTLESLDGGPHPAVGQLNDKWGHDIRARLLNVLFEVTEVAEDRIRVHALNAARDLGPSAQASAPICRLEPTGVDFELAREGCAFTMTAPAGIRIYVGTTAETKNCAPTLPVPNAIPIDRVRLAFTLRPDCAALDDGRGDEGTPRGLVDRVEPDALPLGVSGDLVLHLGYSGRRERKPGPGEIARAVIAPQQAQGTALAREMLELRGGLRRDDGHPRPGVQKHPRLAGADRTAPDDHASATGNGQKNGDVLHGRRT